MGGLAAHRIYSEIVMRKKYDKNLKPVFRPIGGGMYAKVMTLDVEGHIKLGYFRSVLDGDEEAAKAKAEAEAEAKAKAEEEAAKAKAKPAEQTIPPKA
jgi:hypothetical protein